MNAVAVAVPVPSVILLNVGLVVVHYQASCFLLAGVFFVFDSATGDIIFSSHCPLVVTCVESQASQCEKQKRRERNLAFRFCNRISFEQDKFVVLLENTQQEQTWGRSQSQKRRVWIAYQHCYCLNAVSDVPQPPFTRAQLAAQNRPLSTQTNL